MIEKYIYVSDLGSYVNIRVGSRYENLLWKVKDSTAYAHERGKLFYHSRNVYPIDPGTYYFTNPKSASKLFGHGETYNPDKPNIKNYYQERENILLELAQQGLGIHNLLKLPPHLENTIQRQNPARITDFLAPITINGNSCSLNIEKFERLNTPVNYRQDLPDVFVEDP
jgi:hypothetical protein